MENFMNFMLIITFFTKRFGYDVPSESSMLNVLTKSKLSGSWYSTNQYIEQFNFLDHQKGVVEAQIYDNRQIQITFIDGKYLEHKNVRVSFILENYNNQIEIFEGDTIFDIDKNVFIDTLSMTSCKGKYNMKAMQENNGKVSIQMTLVSQEMYESCSFNLKFSANSEKGHFYRNNLIFMIIFIIFAGIYIIATLIMITLKIPKEYKISLSATLLNFLQNLQIQQMMSIQFEINKNYQSFYIIIFSFSFMCQAFNLIFSWQVWKQYYRIEQADWRLKFQHVICYSFLITALIILNYQIFERFLVILLFCFSLMLYPIIFYNIRNKIQERFDKIYILGHLSPKAFYFIYLKINPYNVCGFEPQPLLVFCYLLIFLISLILLKIQQKHGPGYVIGEQQVEQENDVQEQFDIQNENVINNHNHFTYQYSQFIFDQSDNCSICLSALKSANAQTQSQKLDENQQLIQTPCQHVFHYECLLKYMATKINTYQKLCPNCRQQLPNEF